MTLKEFRKTTKDLPEDTELILWTWNHEPYGEECFKLNTPHNFNSVEKGHLLIPRGYRIPIL